MRADHDHLGIRVLRGRLDRNVDVADHFAVGQKFLAVDGIAEGCERRLDVAGNLLEFVVMGHVVLARGNGRDMLLEGLGQRRLFRRERRQRPKMGSAGYGGHIMQRAVGGGCDRKNEKNCEQ